MQNNTLIIDKSDYSKAFKEVSVILSFINKDDLAKIPNDILEVILAEQDLSYNYKLDFKKGFESQKMLDVTKAILSIFYRDYWCTKEEKNQILETEILERIEIENKKREVYNPNSIFNKRKKIYIEENESNALILTKNNSIFAKILQKIKHIFNLD